MKSTFSQYRYHNGKRWIGGTAAYNHFFKENGGIDKVLTDIVAEATRHAVQRVVALFSARKRGW